LQTLLVLVMQLQVLEETPLQMELPMQTLLVVMQLQMVLLMLVQEEDEHCYSSKVILSNELN